MDFLNFAHMKPEQSEYNMFKSHKTWTKWIQYVEVPQSRKLTLSKHSEQNVLNSHKAKSSVWPQWTKYVVELTQSRRLSLSKHSEHNMLTHKAGSWVCPNTMNKICWTYKKTGSWICPNTVNKTCRTHKKQESEFVHSEQNVLNSHKSGSWVYPNTVNKTCWTHTEQKVHFVQIQWTHSVDLTQNRKLSLSKHSENNVSKWHKAENWVRPNTVNTMCWNDTKQEVKIVYIQWTQCNKPTQSKSVPKDIFLLPFLGTTPVKCLTVKLLTETNPSRMHLNVSSMKRNCFSARGAPQNWLWQNRIPHWKLLQYLW